MVKENKKSNVKENIVYVTDDHVMCDGGHQQSGHPRIYLKLKDGKIICPYCSQHFENKTLIQKN